MYIHLFVIIDTPANSSLIMYSLLYIPLFVIVDTPRLAQLHAVSTLICNSRYTMSYLSFSVSIKYGSSWVNKIPTLRLYSQPEYVVFTFLLSL